MARASQPPIGSSPVRPRISPIRLSLWRCFVSGPRRGITKENAVEMSRRGAAAKAVAMRERKLRKAEEDAALAKGTAVLLAAPAGERPSSELVRLAGDIIEAIGRRVLREIDTYPPTALASLASTFHSIKRLEADQSTSNVQVVLSPADRRARIMELAGQLGLGEGVAREVGTRDRGVDCQESEPS